MSAGYRHECDVCGEIIDSDYIKNTISFVNKKRYVIKQSGTIYLHNRCAVKALGMDFIRLAKSRKKRSYILKIKRLSIDLPDEIEIKDQNDLDAVEPGAPTS